MRVRIFRHNALKWNQHILGIPFLDDARPPPTDPLGGALAALGLSDRLARPGNVKEGIPGAVGARGGPKVESIGVVWPLVAPP
eukprot:1177389-Prorocentrum_minimum.AAC.1